MKSHIPSDFSPLDTAAHAASCTCCPCLSHRLEATEKALAAALSAHDDDVETAYFRGCDAGLDASHADDYRAERGKALAAAEAPPEPAEAPDGASDDEKFAADLRIAATFAAINVDSPHRDLLELVTARSSVAIQSKAMMQAAPAPQRPCPRCGGCGQIANDDDGTPWKYWAELPSPSNLAVVMGIVRPIPCPKCQGAADAESEGP